MVSNLLPIQLLRRRREPILRCPLHIRQNNRLQHLHRLEIVLLAQHVAFFHHECLHALVVAQVVQGGMLGVDALDRVPLERMSEMHFVRNDDREWLLGVL